MEAMAGGDVSTAELWEDSSCWPRVCESWGGAAGGCRNRDLEEGLALRRQDLAQTWVTKNGTSWKRRGLREDTG